MPMDQSVVTRTEHAFPSDMEQLANRIKDDLLQLVREQQLPEGLDLQAACRDAQFIDLLLEFAPKAAVRIYAAEQRAAQASEQAMQFVLEQLRARQTLPTPVRGNYTSAPEKDYMSMSPEAFAALERQYRKAAEQGLKVNL